jgi:hypothetical protein
MATIIGGLDFDDPTIRIGEPPNTDGGVRVQRWTCAKLVEQMVQLLEGMLSFYEEEKKDTIRRFA